MSSGKTFLSAKDAVADVFDGASIAVGGFAVAYNHALSLLKALAARPEVKNLTIIANGFPHQPLAENRQVRKFIGAFGGSVYRRGIASEELIRSGEIEFEPCPQGILTERLRAGAAGIPAFYSPVGVGTVVAEGKEGRVFGGREYLLETALQPDFAFVRAHKADEAGNLYYEGSTINFHPTMAAAARVTIAEVDEIVPVGQLNPNDVRVPGIYIDRIIRRETSDEELAQTQAARQRRETPSEEGRVGLSRELMALRAAQLLRPGQIVNLGMGLPVLVGNFISPQSGVILHGENGIMGYGPNPSESEIDWNHYNASGQPVTLLPGAAFFSSLEAFTMARGGHLDVVILGGLQVSERGDLANWWAPYMAAGGMGGAMDLCAGCREVIIIMEHTTRDGQPKIVKECSYPLTAGRCVTKVVTELAYIEVTAEGLLLREVAPGVTPDYVAERTEPRLMVAPDCKEMQF